MGRLRLPADAAAQGSGHSGPAGARACARGPAPAPRRSSSWSRGGSRRRSPRTSRSRRSSRTPAPASPRSTSRWSKARADTGKEFDDIKLKLDAITDLPDGAGPIEFVKDFGDTAALMLTVASPQRRRRGDRARARRRCGRRSRRRARRRGVRRPRRGHARAGPARPPCRPSWCAGRCGSSPRPRRPTALLRDARVIVGPGFVGVDAASDHDDASARGVRRSASSASGCVRPSSIPTPGRSAIVRDPADTPARLARRRRRQIQLSRAGRLHRPHRAHAEDAADRLEGDARRACCRSASTSSTRRSGSASYGVKVGIARAGARRPQHHDARRRDRVGRQEPHRRSVGRVQERAGDRRRAGVDRPTAGRSTCATSRRSAAATRARRGS